MCWGWRAGIERKEEKPGRHFTAFCSHFLFLLSQSQPWLFTISPLSLCGSSTLPSSSSAYIIDTGHQWIRLSGLQRTDDLPAPPCLSIALVYLSLSISVSVSSPQANRLTKLVCGGEKKKRSRYFPFAIFHRRSAKLLRNRSSAVQMNRLHNSIPAYLARAERRSWGKTWLTAESQYHPHLQSSGEK